MCALQHLQIAFTRLQCQERFTGNKLECPKSVVQKTILSTPTNANLLKMHHQVEQQLIRNPTMRVGFAIYLVIRF